MKKYLALLLAVVMTLSLVACGEKNPNPAPDDVDNQDQQTEPVSDIWLPYNEDLSAKRDDRDATGKNGAVASSSYYASKAGLATVYKGNIIKNLIMDCQSYTKYRPNETTGGIFVSWRRKEELPTGA